MHLSVPLLPPSHLVTLRQALDYWHHGNWDDWGFDWVPARSQKLHPLRVALAKGDIAASLFSEDGTLEPIPKYLWNGNLVWGEAYESSLVNVQLNRGICSGYMTVDRVVIETLRTRSQSNQKDHGPLPQSVVEAIMSENAAIGLAVEALQTEEMHRSPEKTVEEWLRVNWLESLHAPWPNPASGGRAPSLARQINVVIRHGLKLPYKWLGEPPKDDTLAALTNRLPVLAAALAVSRLCRTGELDHNKGGTVLPRVAQSHIVKLTSPPAMRPLLECAAAIAIPDDKVSGGGRKRKVQARRALLRP